MSAKLVLKDISNIVKSARVCAASSANSQPQKVIWQQQKKFPQSEASEIVSEPDNKNPLEHRIQFHAMVGGSLDLSSAQYDTV
jgi:hypothetical protein